VRTPPRRPEVLRRAAVPRASVPRYTEDVAIEEGVLLSVVQAAAAAWPGVTLAPEVFLGHLRARLEDTDTAATLEKIHTADLYLACACLHGDEQAWRELDKQHLARVPQFVGRIDGTPAFSDEVRQRLGEKLIRETDGPAKLALYTGRGPFGAWLRVAAIREAQNLKRRGKKTVDANDIALAATDHDPEMMLLKQRFAAEFSEAFKAVLVTLSSDERNVLRLHYLDGLTVEEVGKVYRVSRATAARWIASARDTIIERTQAALGDRLGESAPRAQSLLAFVKSQLDLSLRRHFTP
jgi:RNA polymerase sigma-70 factor, ECF subfamily